MVVVGGALLEEREREGVLLVGTVIAIEVAMVVVGYKFYIYVLPRLRTLLLVCVWRC